MTRRQTPIEPTRKPYTAPRLVNYGSVARLTAGGMVIGNDGNTECSGNASTAVTPCDPGPGPTS